MKKAMFKKCANSLSPSEGLSYWYVKYIKRATTKRFRQYAKREALSF